MCDLLENILVVKIMMFVEVTVILLKINATLSFSGKCSGNEMTSYTL
jgi:hypothetical protein